MTIGDFLAQAGFWQWIGIIFLAGALASFRPFTFKRYYKDPEK